MNGFVRFAHLVVVCAPLGAAVAESAPAAEKPRQAVEVAAPVGAAPRNAAPGAQIAERRGPKVTDARFSSMLLKHGAGPWSEAAEGIEYVDVHVGTGNPVIPHATLFLRWDMFDGEGWGIEIQNEHGARSSQYIYGIADVNMLGDERLLRAFEKGIASMREGGRRLVRVDAEQAFGATGSTDPALKVPPDTDLVFEVSLMWVRKVDPKRFTASEPMSRSLEVPGNAGSVP